MSDSTAPVVAEAELSAAPPGGTARLILDPGYVNAETAAVARNLAQSMLT